MRVWDERYQGKKPVKHTGRQGARVHFVDTTKQEQPQKPTSVPVGMQTTDVRARANRQVEAPVTEDAVLAVWHKSVADEKERARIAQKAAEQRRAEAAAKAEDERKAVEVRERQRQWYAEQRKEQERQAFQSVTMQDVADAMTQELAALAKGEK